MSLFTVLFEFFHLNLAANKEGICVGSFTLVRIDDN